MKMEVAAILLFLIVTVTGQSVEVRPPNAVRRVGEEVAFLCRVAYPIDSCRFLIGGVNFRLRPDELNGNVVYAGQGLQVGECGARIKRVEDSMNGKIVCNLPPQTGSVEPTGEMNLTVARAPGQPILNTPRQQTFRENEQFEAQCVVPNGRPVARIAWYIDEIQIFDIVHQPVISQDPNSDLVTISQNITKVMHPDDNGRSLICKAEHEALQQPLTVSRQLFVDYPPLPVPPMDSEFLTIFGLKMGEEGRLNVTVRANPPPHADWRVDDRHLPAGEQNEWGLALDPIALGNGYFNITFLIPRVSKEAVERTYHVTVANAHGEQRYRLRISTMDEPAGVELDTGAIVGIVIAVLALLIAVFLIVFAKATDRWCFAGSSRIRDHTKSSGESSDTESAVGGRSERSRLAELSARVRAALPRPRDKVQATDPPATPQDTEEKPLSEEKKGVVYAELALAEQPGDKPPPPSTEYAEIVYTDQPEQRTTPEHKE